MVTDSSTSVGNLAMGAAYLCPPVWSRGREPPGAGAFSSATPHQPAVDARYTTALARGPRRREIYTISATTAAGAQDARSSREREPRTCSITAHVAREPGAAWVQPTWRTRRGYSEHPARPFPGAWATRACARTTRLPRGRARRNQRRRGLC